MKEFRKRFYRTWKRREWSYRNHLKNRELDTKFSHFYPSFLKLALCTSFLSYFHLHALNSDGSDALTALSLEEIASMQKETYTINFNNISMLEFLRFASKMTSLNFIFEEPDLQFNVSVISQEPVTAKNVMSALAQILRIHGLVLLEQDGNVIITKNTTVRQISPIISSEQPEAPLPNVVLVTRVFRIKNASLSTVASIIRPMTSDSALIEISNETKQLIVTDIASNVEQIATLLLSLDSPHSSLEIDTYTVKVIAPDLLIPLTHQILSPFTEGNPLIFVPQKETNSIFIVSTPHLIERALIVMEDLDIPPKEVQVGKTFLAKRNVFIYKVTNRSLNDLVSELTNIISQMKTRGVEEPALEHAIEGVEMAEDTNSLIFLADDETTAQLKTILASLDTPTTAKATYYIYKIQKASQEQIRESLKQFRDKLKASPRPDTDLIKTIDTMQWNEETNSLIFTGSPASIDQIKDILPTFDMIVKAGTTKSTFLIYTPQYRNGEELYNYLEETARNLKQSGLSNPSLLQTLDTMKWTPSSNSLLFTGDPQSLERVQSILISIDTPTSYSSKATEVFVYKPRYASPEQIQGALNSLIPSLESTNTHADQALASAIQSLKWNAETQAFTVTTEPSTVERLRALIASFDSPQQATSPFAQGFILYKLQYAKGDIVIQELKGIASKIPPSSIKNKNLIEAINKLEWVRSNNSLIITGSPEAIDQIKTMLADFDVPSGTPVPTGAQTFYIYKPQYAPAEEILAVLKDLSSDMQAAGLQDPTLFETINSARYVSATNSLLFAGNQDSLDKVKKLITTIDVSQPTPALQTVGTLTFLLYKLQGNPDQFIASMKSFASNLQTSNATDKELAEAIDTMKYIKENNSILFTGTTQALQKIEDLASKFDIPSKEAPITPIAPPTVPPSSAEPTTLPTTPTLTPPRDVSTFVIYNPKYLSGEELISIMCDFMDHLISTDVSNPDLFDAINSLKWIPKTSSLLISGTPESIHQVQGLLEKFDIPSGTATAPSIETFENTSFLVYKLQFHTGVDIQSALKQIAGNLARGANPNTILADAIDSLQWLQPTNSLIATGPQDILIKLKELIQNIDVPLRQVFIEVLVIQTSLSNVQNFGLQWGSQFKYFNKTMFQTGNFIPTTPNFSNTISPINATTTPNNSNFPLSNTTGFDLGVIGDIIMHKGRSFLSLGSLLQAIQQDVDTNIIINQKIITQDNRQSTIFVGTNVPYTGSIVTNSQSNTTTTSNIEYRDVGVNLTITPVLGESDIITMDIVQDLSQVIQNASSTNSTQLTGITTSHAHMETRVSVPDDKFLVLSGMIEDSKLIQRTGIPCLGSLPVVGLLFSQNNRTNTKGPNIIIFVRPKIINSVEDYKKATEHQEWLFKDQAKIPLLKEGFDEGLDLVKLPEDE